MSPATSFITGLLSWASIRPRQTLGFPEYTTVLTEPSAVCRKYADMLGDVSFRLYNGPAVNITCWAESSMLDDEKGRYDDSSWMWAWALLDPTKYPDPSGDMGVGNIEQGGVAGGYGCWMHEDDMQGEDLYLPDEIRWCGDAPHHQVGSPAGFNAFFACRNCTDLGDSACQTTYPTDFPGYTDTGCWKHGTEIDGNSTWVALIEPPLENCFISPDQFDPNEWHGPPATECQD